ncbi:hypothetical protein GF312_19040 [Candidatus Poribacteria bacterium]|nr:hypothetical protein [Candidatus Poribacteria bacterium]
MFLEIAQWIPRIIGFAIAGFCYMFMLELSTEGWGAALSHFIQGTAFLILTLLSWKWGFWGGLLYISFGIFIVIKERKGRFVVIASTTLILTGIMFIIF